MSAASLYLEQIQAEARYESYVLDEDEREFWNGPLREGIRRGALTPIPLARADEAGLSRPDIFGCCQLCGFQTRETKDGMQFCRACEAPK